MKSCFVLIPKDLVWLVFSREASHIFRLLQGIAIGSPSSLTEVLVLVLLFRMLERHECGKVSPMAYLASRTKVVFPSERT